MNFKKLMVFLLFSFVASLQIVAVDYATISENDCEMIVLNVPPSAEGQCSINYLENRPDASWFWPITTGFATLIPLSVATIPGSLTCKLAGALACILTTAETGVIGFLATVAGIASTGILYCKSKKHAKKKQQYLELAQIIKDAYCFESMPTNSVQQLLDEYQALCPTDKHTGKDLAAKIVLANEAGLFVPADAFIMIKESALAAYELCRDLPKRNAILQELTLGTLFNKDSREVVNDLIGMTKEELQEKKLAFEQGVKTWQEQIRKFLEQVETASAIRKKSLDQCAFL